MDYGWLTRPSSPGQFVTPQSLSQSSYPFPLSKQENVDSKALQVSSQPTPVWQFSDALMPSQTSNFSKPSSLEHTSGLEVYNPGANLSEEQANVSVSDPVVDQECPLPALSKPTDLSRQALPVVGAFTVQCARCFKWRLIPTKEQYEAIRQCILEEPWVCERACSWRPNASCDDPADLSQDMSRLWAIDKPNIPQPPPGWERLVSIRRKGACKFADVYYVSPSGKKLRSMVEIERFLLENPEYSVAGVHISQFSYQTPKPLYQGYVRKRNANGILEADMCQMRRDSEIEKNFDITQGNPITGRRPAARSTMGVDNGVSYEPTMQSDNIWRQPFLQFTRRKRSSRIKTRSLSMLMQLSPQ